MGLIIYDGLVIRGSQFAELPVMQRLEDVICAFVELHALCADIAEMRILSCHVDLLECNYIFCRYSAPVDAPAPQGRMLFIKVRISRRPTGASAALAACKLSQCRSRVLTLFAVAFPASGRTNSRT